MEIAKLSHQINFMLKRILILGVFLLGFNRNVYSQNFEWIKQIGDIQVDHNPKCKLLQNGQSIISWSFGDSTKVDSFKKKSNKYTSPCAVSLLDKNGKAKWVWSPDSCTSYMHVNAISYSESLSKIFICGNFQNKIVINSIIYNGYSNGFVIRLDTNGAFEKIYILSDTSVILFETMDLNYKDEVFLGIYYNGTYKSPLSIPELSFSMSKKGYFVLKLDNSLVPKMVSSPAYGLRSGRVLINLTTNQNIINTYTFIDTVTIGGKTYYNGNNIRSTFLTHLDSNLKIKKNALLFTCYNSYASINSLKSLNNGDLLIGGVFEDSISILPRKNYANSFVPLFACLDSNLKLKWAKMPEVKASGTITSEILDINILDGFIYAGGFFIGDAVYDDFNLPTNEGILWFFKSDNRGNILWMNKTGTSNSYQYITSISANKQKGVLLGGLIIDTVKLKKQTFITTKNKPDILLMKIRDIEIYRGFVKSGPYCAGDTIKIPYTIEGNFTSGNQFIAELSDADGNFTGNHRELGRVSSTNDSFIKGIIPLFNVESSPFYRIRIISTNPVVQSYYKYDTLRLLIYSRDKANAGFPETICQGDSIKLNTQGGSVWNWSPKYNISDSTLRKPWVWPMHNTTYKIIISDSSGCGKPDTAFKEIIVRKALSATLAFQDTNLCKATPIQIPVLFSGGDSANYQWKWYSFAKLKRWKIIDSGQVKLNDTLLYTPNITFFNTDTLAIVLSDGCTNKPDTVFLSMALLKPCIIQSMFKDTLLCHGQILGFKAISEYNGGKNAKWLWNDLISNSNLSITTELNLTAKNSLKVGLLYSNGCTSDADTFNIQVNPPLQSIINSQTGVLNDTSLCAGQSINLSAKAKGGMGKNYTYAWFFDGKFISDSISVFFKPANEGFLDLVINDNCTVKADTRSKFITVLESPLAMFNYGLACSRSSIPFNFSGTLPKSPIITLFNWNFNNESSSTLQNPTLSFLTPGFKTIELNLISSNGCLDTIRSTIDVKPTALAKFVVADGCESDSINFANMSDDATSYQWKFGDGSLSILQNPKHWFDIQGVTRTFNVSLVALVKEGCSDSISKPVTINANPISEFNYTITDNKAEFKALGAGNVYKWNFGNGDSATEAKGNYTYNYSKITGTYTVCLEVKNLAECFSKTCKEILVAVGITAVKKSIDCIIYPNPNSGSFALNIKNSQENITIQVFDILGNLIKKVELMPNKTVYSIDLNVADGMYLVQVNNGTTIYNQKVNIIH